jgi:hypothetical protein
MATSRDRHMGLGKVSALQKEPYRRRLQKAKPAHPLSVSSIPPEARPLDVGHDKNSMSDYSVDPPRSSGDTYSEAAHSPAVKEPWALGGGQIPVADSYLLKAESEARAAVDLSAVSQLDERTVRRLARSYMRYRNVMH